MIKRILTYYAERLEEYLSRLHRQPEGLATVGFCRRGMPQQGGHFAGQPRKGDFGRHDVYAAQRQRIRRQGSTADDEHARHAGGSL